MKIAILVPNYSDYSGDARVAAMQAEELSKEGNEVSIFAFASDIKNSSADINVMGMPRGIFWQRIYRLLFPLDFVKLWIWLPRFKEFDRIIAHIYPMTFIGYLAKKRYGVEYFFWFHGIEDPKIFSRFSERFYMRLFIQFSKFSLRNVDQAISVSEFAKAKLMEYLNVNSIVKYNEVIEGVFHKNIDGTKIRNKYNLQDSPVILSIGRLIPQKKFELLIKAFYEVKNEFPNAKLMIIGKPTFDKYYDELKKMSDGSIIFIDFIPNKELPFYYAMSDIYAICSLWETYNLPLAEAQACGKSVVVFDIGSHSEVINEKGCLVRAGDIKDFARACIKKIREARGMRL